MLAVVFADRHGEELAPLNAQYAPAMLPVAGKPMLEHTLEILRQYKTTRVIIVVREHADKIKSYFADGHRWSMAITYMMSRKNEQPDELIRRIDQQVLSSPFLALRGDIWNGHVEQHPDFYCYEVSEPHQSINTLDWPHFQAQSTNDISLVKHLQDYHRLVIQTEQKLSAEMAAKKLPSQLSLGIQADCNLTNIENGSLSLGHYSRLARSVRCSETVVVGNNCIVDEGARLNDTIVMDGTYIGPGMDLNHAIVFGNTLIRIDLDIVCPIDEPFMLGDSAIRTLSTATLLERFFALVTLACLLPVWIYLGLFAFFSGRRIFTNKTIQGLKGFRSFVEFSVAHRTQGIFSKLLAVVSGHLNLFGRAPLSDEQFEEDHFSPWHEQYLRLPIGWISPAILQAGADTDPIIVQLTEIELYQKGAVHYLLSSVYLLLKNAVQLNGPLAMVKTDTHPVQLSKKS